MAVIKTPYQNYLTVLKGGKSVPYCGVTQDDGSINHGFRNLKGKIAEATDIPEVHNDPSLKLALDIINRSETDFFTVGCVSGEVDEEQGKRISGYVEFCINDQKNVKDANYYFYIFYHFIKCLEKNNFQQHVTYHWELLGAHFLDKKCDGYTCAITVNTHYHDTMEEAKQCWDYSLKILAEYLSEYKSNATLPIY